MATDYLSVTMTSVLTATVERVDRHNIRIRHVRFDVPIRPNALGFAQVQLNGPGYSIGVEDEPGTLVHLVPAEYRRALDLDSENEVQQCFQRLVEAISGIHGAGAPVSGVLPELPPWGVRLAGYLETAGRTKQGTIAELTPHRLRQTLQSVLRRMSHGTVSAIHGAPSLGSTYYNGSASTVLVGVDLAMARPELDWGYLLGELDELALFGSHPVARFAAALTEILRDTIRIGDLDMAYVHEVAIAKRFLHLVDYESTCRAYNLPVPDVTGLKGVITELTHLAERVERETL